MHKSSLVITFLLPEIESHKPREKGSLEVYNLCSSVCVSMVNSSTTNSGSFGTKRARSPEPPPKTKIKLFIKNQQDGNEDVFRIGVHVPLKRLMSAYSQKRNLDYRTLRFIYNGHKLNARQTPAQLTMEDNDLIDMFMEAPGGGGSFTV